MISLSAVNGQQQEDGRHKLKLNAAIGSARSLPLANEEPKIITEPLPGQEFVFFSANPAQSRLSSSSVAGGRTARLNNDAPIVQQKKEDEPVVFDALSPDWFEHGAGVSSARFAATSGVPTVQGENVNASSAASDPVEPFDHFAAVQSDNQWRPLSLPELLSGSSIVLPKDVLPLSVPFPTVEEPIVAAAVANRSRSEDGRSVSIADPPVPEQFTIQDVVTAAPAADRDSKSISHDDESANLIPAESVSRRSVIKTATNGQDYEYEYLYYDEPEEIDELTGINHPQEPSILDQDQDQPNPTVLLVGNPQKVIVLDATDVAPDSIMSTVPIPIPIEELGFTFPQSDATTTERPVDEPLHEAKFAFTVAPEIDDDADHETSLSTEDDLSVEVVTTTPLPETTTTTTTTTAAPSTTKRMRTSRPTTESKPSRMRTTTVKNEEIEETSTKKSTGGKTRISSANSQKKTSPVNTVAADEDVQVETGSPRRNRIKPKEGSRSRSTTTARSIESRVGLADPQDFDDDRDASGEDRDARLILVDSNSFRKKENRKQVAAAAVVDDQDDEEEDESDSKKTVGRLTVLSGPAPRLNEDDQVTHPQSKKKTSQKQKQKDNHHSDNEDDEPVKAPVIIEAQVFTGVADTPAADDVSSLEDVGEVSSESPLQLSPSRPDLTDLLAFSRTVEQQQQDDQVTQVPEIEEFSIEEIFESTTAKAKTTPTSSTTSQSEELDDDDVVSKATPVDIDQSTETSSVLMPADAAADDDIIAVTENLSDEISAETSAPELDDDITTTEAPTTTTPKPTTTTTTTTTQKPTTTTSTAAPSTSRGRPTNANRFGANRIRNKVTEDPLAGSTTAPTPTSPRNRPSFTRGSTANSALNSRLRRPSTAAPSDDVQAEDSSSSSDQPSTTRRPVSSGIRNRFGPTRRPSTTSSSDPSADSTTPQSVDSSRPTTASRPRLAVSNPSAVNRVVSPRPISSILRRGKPTPTTTTTTEAAAGGSDTAAVEDEDNVAAPVTDVSAEIEDTSSSSSSQKTTTTSTTTTTTTSKPAGLSRLKSRPASLAVSERPKTVRNQVSINDRRNRFSGLNKNKTTSEGTSSSESSAPDASGLAEKTEEHFDDDEPVEDETKISETSVPAPGPAVFSLRSLRPNRKPGQFAPIRPARSS